jgi:hypothetical protein
MLMIRYLSIDQFNKGIEWESHGSVVHRQSKVMVVYINKKQAHQLLKNNFSQTWDSMATLLLTRSVVVIATAAEPALHIH